jgi:hypothetical protein
MYVYFENKPKIPVQGLNAGFLNLLQACLMARKWESPMVGFISLEESMKILSTASPCISHLPEGFGKVPGKASLGPPAALPACRAGLAPGCAAFPARLHGAPGRPLPSVFGPSALSRTAGPERPGALCIPGPGGPLTLLCK